MTEAEPVNVAASLIVGDDAVELSADEVAGVEHLYELFGALADRCAAANTAVTLHVVLPEGPTPLGNDLVIMCQTGGYFSAWSQGDPTRGYHH